MRCPECGMGYIPELAEDVKEHEKYHDKIMNGAHGKKIISDKILWEKGDDRIAVVNFFSPIPQKMRAQEAGLIANKDTSFDFAPYHSNEALDDRNVHIFLFYRKNRIIGFLIVEKKQYVQKFTWQEFEKASGEELPKGKAIWSVGLAWVHKKFRKTGLGSQLVKVAAMYFNIAIQSIGWYTPFTEEGEKLARSICSEYFYVAK